MMWPCDGSISLHYLVKRQCPRLTGTFFSFFAHLESAGISHLGIVEHADLSVGTPFTLGLASCCCFHFYLNTETVSETSFPETLS